MSYFKPRNFLLVLALVLALVLLAFIAMRYRPELELETVVKALPKGVDVSFQDIDYTHIDGGRARWRLVARQVERQAQSAVLIISHPQVSFFDENGDVEGSMQSVHGEVSDDFLKVLMYDEVVVKNDTGYTLYTDRINYDNDTQTATTDAHVRLSGQGLDLEGRGMVLNLNTKTVHLKSQVKGILQPR